MMQSIADIRKDYAQKTLTEADVLPNAIQQFGIWWDEAVKSRNT
jgi:pyridoxamine 5'-phosphate oxidase